MKLPYLLLLMMVAPATVAALPATVPATRAATRPATAPFVPAHYEVRQIEGWTVYINQVLLVDHPKTTDRAIELITGQLKEIRRTVPAEAVGHLQQVPIWINPEYPGVPPRAEYHDGTGWLRSNGRDPQMARGVEFTNVRIFERECARMPSLVLHELAHAYHSQVLGYDQPEIIAAYRRAKESKSYDHVERSFGDPARPNRFEKAYAMTSHMEYFAETTEALFGRNDFYPFNASELEKHDPEMFALLAKLWKTPVKPGEAPADAKR